MKVSIIPANQKGFYLTYSKTILLSLTSQRLIECNEKKNAECF